MSMGTLMETYNELVLSLGQLGVEVKIEPRLTPRGICVNWRARRHAMVLLKQEGDLKALAHEAVHVLQYLYSCYLVGLPLVGLNPLQFNPNLRGDMQVLPQMWATLKQWYPRSEWEVEVPAYAMQEEPQLVLALLKAVIAKVELGGIRI